jgi:hypothetical protein
MGSFFYEQAIGTSVEISKNVYIAWEKKKNKKDVSENDKGEWVSGSKAALKYNIK